jgi:hypothetical protein
MLTADGDRLAISLQSYLDVTCADVEHFARRRRVGNKFCNNRRRVCERHYRQVITSLSGCDTIAPLSIEA